MNLRARTWDVFCRVVDNYGDAAVCWRLARQLAAEYGLSVRLRIDDLGALHLLNPAISPVAPAQHIDGVTILHGYGNGEDAADVVIEAFGCGLPDGYVESMARRKPASLWITLEYLSAEPWVRSHHGLPSPHPRLSLQRYFFFPGFEQGTGGLLLEQGLPEKRDAMQADACLRDAFWRGMGFAPPEPAAHIASLFGYENPAVGALLQLWSQGERPMVVVVPASRLRPEIAAWFGERDPSDGCVLSRGKLEARFIPFLPQARYDQLLWLCDWNFVRGEDSFVRAQWAARPLVWHIYPQQEGAHWVKLNAFLDRYTEGMEAEPASALRSLWIAWNGGHSEHLAGAWANLARHRDVLARHALSWANRLKTLGDLAKNLMHFCEGKVQ